MSSQLEFTPYQPLFSDLCPKLTEQFIEYHKSNPHVFELFKRFAYEARARWDHFGAKAIYERLRWEADIYRESRQFKLNNNFPSFYARLLIFEDPSFKTFFELRRTPGTVEEAA